MTNELFSDLQTLVIIIVVSRDVNLRPPVSDTTRYRSTNWPVCCSNKSQITRKSSYHLPTSRLYPTSTFFGALTPRTVLGVSSRTSSCVAINASRTCSLAAITSNTLPMLKHLSSSTTHWTFSFISPIRPRPCKHILVKQKSLISLLVASTKKKHQTFI